MCPCSCINKCINICFVSVCGVCKSQPAFSLWRRSLGPRWMWHSKPWLEENWWHSSLWNCANQPGRRLRDLLSLLSASSCLLLKIHAPPYSFLPKIHDIKCCLTTCFWRRHDNKWSALHRIHAWNFSHVASVVVSLYKEISKPGCCFVPSKYVPDARCQSVPHYWKHSGMWCRIQAAQPADPSLRPNRTSAFVHEVDNLSIGFPHAYLLFNCPTVNFFLPF